jgi:hypothetical protein
MVQVILRLALALLLLASHASWAQDAGRDGETRIKAAFLAKFGDFVEWPPTAFAGPQERFTIGVMGADALGAELERVVATRTVHGRPVAVRRLHRGEPLDGLHVLFVGAAETAALAQVLRMAPGRALLVVTESDEALAAGSMINFVPEASRVRFDIALAAAQRAELRISARLLSVARKVVSS